MRNLFRVVDFGYLSLVSRKEYDRDKRKRIIVVYFSLKSVTVLVCYFQLSQFMNYLRRMCDLVKVTLSLEEIEDIHYL